MASSSSEPDMPALYSSSPTAESDKEDWQVDIHRQSLGDRGNFSNFKQMHTNVERNLHRLPLGTEREAGLPVHARSTFVSGLPTMSRMTENVTNMQETLEHSSAVLQNVRQSGMEAENDNRSEPLPGRDEEIERLEEKLERAHDKINLLEQGMMDRDEERDAELTKRDNKIARLEREIEDLNDKEAISARQSREENEEFVKDMAMDPDMAHEHWTTIARGAIATVRRQSLAIGKQEARNESRKKISDLEEELKEKDEELKEHQAVSQREALLAALEAELNRVKGERAAHFALLKDQGRNLERLAKRIEGIPAATAEKLSSMTEGFSRTRLDEQGQI